jgi:hypothetical protein
MNEMAGARWDGSATTACSETKTADWATPVPKPLDEGGLVGGHMVNRESREGTVAMLLVVVVVVVVVVKGARDDG